MKNFIILVFGFDLYQINFVTLRSNPSDYSISYVSDFAYKFCSFKDAACVVDLLKSRYVGLRYEIVECNCLNFD